MKKLILFIFCLLFISINFADAGNSTSKKKVAILVYEGVYLLDFAGPLEIFNDAMMSDTAAAFEVYLVGVTKDPIKAHTGTIITPNYSINDCPKPDILVIPGGDLGLGTRNQEVGDWIKSESAKSEITMSVCTGAFILADLGLLDSMEATTWYGAVDRLGVKYPKINVAHGKRFTDNGKIITTAGVSAGIDGALHIVERYFGRDAAARTAKFIEYNR